jgi:hypothetical protein
MTKSEIALNAFNQLENEFTGHDFARLCKKNGLEKSIKNTSSRINFRTDYCKKHADKLTQKTWRKKVSGSIHLINYKEANIPSIQLEIENMLTPKKQKDPVNYLLDIAKDLNNKNDQAVLIKAALMIIENGH